MANWSNVSSVMLQILVKCKVHKSKVHGKYHMQHYGITYGRSWHSSEDHFYIIIQCPHQNYTHLYSAPLTIWILLWHSICRLRKANVHSWIRGEWRKMQKQERSARKCNNRHFYTTWGQWDWIHNGNWWQTLICSLIGALTGRRVHLYMRSERQF